MVDHGLVSHYHHTNLSQLSCGLNVIRTVRRRPAVLIADPGQFPPTDHHHHHHLVGEATSFGAHRHRHPDVYDDPETASEDLPQDDDPFDPSFRAPKCDSCGGASVLFPSVLGCSSCGQVVPLRLAVVARLATMVNTMDPLR